MLMAVLYVEERERQTDSKIYPPFLNTMPTPFTQLIDFTRRFFFLTLFRLGLSRLGFVLSLTLKWKGKSTREKDMAGSSSTSLLLFLLIYIFSDL
jgi:hypothetical protein